VIKLVPLHKAARDNKEKRPLGIPGSGMFHERPLKKCKGHGKRELCLFCYMGLMSPAIH